MARRIVAKARAGNAGVRVVLLMAWPTSVVAGALPLDFGEPTDRVSRADARAEAAYRRLALQLGGVPIAPVLTAVRLVASAKERLPFKLFGSDAAVRAWFGRSLCERGVGGSGLGRGSAS